MSDLIDGFSHIQQTWMRAALSEARLAMDEGDVPVGAVVVYDGKIIGRGHNRRERDHDPCAHAEILALTEAGKAMGSRRLVGAEMYVTMEPCPMCAYALVLAQISLLVYGMDDPKAGACGSLINLAQFPGFEHSVSIRSGLYSAQASEIMRSFFGALRR